MFNLKEQNEISGNLLLNQSISNFQSILWDVDMRTLPIRIFTFQTEADWVSQYQYYQTVAMNNIISAKVNAINEERECRLVW